MAIDPIYLNGYPFVVPENAYFKKEVLLRSLEDISTKIKEAIRTLDITKPNFVYGAFD